MAIGKKKKKYKKTTKKKRNSLLTLKKVLGLKKMHHTVEIQDTPEVRGMINAINFMLKVES